MTKREMENKRIKNMKKIILVVMMVMVPIICMAQNPRIINKTIGTGNDTLLLGIKGQKTIKVEVASGDSAYVLIPDESGNFSVTNYIALYRGDNASFKFDGTKLITKSKSSSNITIYNNGIDIARKLQGFSTDEEYTWVGTQTFYDIVLNGEHLDSLLNAKADTTWVLDKLNPLLGIDTSKILDPVDFAGGKFIQESNGSFIPVSASDLLGYKELIVDVIINSADSLAQVTVIHNTTGTPNNSITATYQPAQGFDIHFTAITGTYYVLAQTQFYYSQSLYATGGYLTDEAYTGVKTTNPNIVTLFSYNTLFAVNTDNLFDSHIPITIKFYP